MDILRNILRHSSKEHSFGEGLEWIPCPWGEEGVEDIKRTLSLPFDDQRIAMHQLLRENYQKRNVSADKT